MSRKAVVLGAGITGLSAAAKLAEAGFAVLVAEREDVVGGMSATFTHGDCRLDYGPHKIFTVLEEIDREIRALFGPGELLEIPKKSRIRLNGRYLNYPLGLKDIFLGLGLWSGFRCGLGYGLAILGNLVSRREAKTYRDWLTGRFGRAIHDLVFAPYARKIWGEPDQLAKELAASRVAAPNLLEMLRQMLFGQRKTGPVIHADVFAYPRAGVSELPRKLAERVARAGGTIRLNSEASAVEFGSDGRAAGVVFADGRRERLGADDVLISTIPLDVFLAGFSPAAEPGLTAAAAGLRTRNLILLYVVLDRDRVFADNWLFFPEARYRFNRVYEQKAFSESMVPRGKTVLCAEITCDPADPLWTLSDAELFARLEPQLREAELLPGRVLESFTRRLTRGYPVYDLEYRARLDAILAGLARRGNVFAVGRQGGFSYTGMADSMDIGFRTAEFIAAARPPAEWPEYTRRFYNYLVVD